MEMAVPAKIIDPAQGYFNPGELANAPLERAAARPYLARALQIVTVLQTSLEAEKVIELFSHEMAVTIPHDSISYTNETHRIALTLGETSEHRCSYRLVVAGKLVGQVSLTRVTPFDSDEVEELEYLLCSLVYPMLNALKYRDALDSALRDPLTKLSNRTMLDVSLKREIDLARRHKTPLSMVVIDVDDFKQVNDTYGHAVGDEVLKCIAACIAKCTRATDVVARYGGEEFVMLLSNTDQQGGVLLAERTRQAVIEAGCEAQGGEVKVTISLGVSTLKPDEDRAGFFERADQALYHAKSQGKNCVKVADGC